jgi:hypothetical protein
VSDGWYETTGRPVTRFKDIPRFNKLLARDLVVPTTVVRAQKLHAETYACGGCRELGHEPLHGSRGLTGERLMRTDDCIYCTQRIIQLHTGTEWDLWRTVASVKPSTIIEELPY